MSNEKCACGAVLGKNGSGIPLREGYSFAGTKGGSILWKKNTAYDIYKVDETNFGKDDGVAPIEGGAPITAEYELGSRGEAIYTLKTAYTEISIDGEKDPVYDYGLHLKGAHGSDEEYYKNRSTCIEIYMIRGQDGRIYVYGEITDPDIVISPEVMAKKPHHCDGLHPYVSFDNNSIYPNCLGLISADVECKYQHQMPKNCVAKLTETGYKFEYAFDKCGKPLFPGEEMGFGFYYNDTNDFVDPENFKRCIVKLPQTLNPVGTKYIPLELDSITFDAVRFSAESACGGIEASERSKTAAVGDIFADIISGAKRVKVIYSEDTPVHNRVVARESFRLLNCYGADSFASNSASPVKADIEIHISLTDCPESSEFANSLEYNEYGIRITEDKIFLAGCREEGIKKAAGLLFSALEYVKNGGRTEDMDTEYVAAVDWVPNAPKMDGIERITDAGYGAYLLMKRNADESDFDAYARKLLSAGYTVHAENTMASVKCVTFVNGEAMINLTYCTADRSLRAVVDPIDMNGLPVVENETYLPVCKNTLTQLATLKIYYMCYIFKLDNGEFLVFDSGGNGAYKHVHDSLVELNGGKHVTVACWIFSHFHCDHIGGFLEMGDREELMKDITVKRIIHNFPQKQVTDTALNPGDQNNLARWPGVVERAGARVYHARTGQKWRFANVELECLFSFEDLMPFDTIADRTNPTSTAFSVTVEGQRLLITGDCTRESTALMAKRYGEWLKADFVQLPHHGWGDGGTAVEFYQCSTPRFVLYPGPAYSPFKAEQWVLAQAEEYFLNTNENATIELPYKKK